MLSQQKADDDLLKVYGKMIAIVVLLIILAILGARYVKTEPNLTSQGLAFEHNRLLNVLAMVRSQWLTSGRPNKMLLSWYDVAPNVLKSTEGDATSQTSKNGQLTAPLDSGEAELIGTDNWIKLSAKGWPIVDTFDDEGCRRLWQQLLATQTSELALSVVYHDQDKVCRYASPNQASLSYQLLTGRVIFLSADK
ncbi:MSHA biogenesis protein MshF [Shewanella inventionis]|uniref:MSHA biogenesis protein MshF n=1 Tax=Shewanella inventionis TaxID=1738770 RepID=A0ABQ1JCF2_9GAMM|nr:MSHA biogenesis protein MshF [Shewanella inventionis]MCL1157994.1 MSHA biogenesis protein MshF [Shewanella inventionis]UAL44063.1 MSHA biogenesis protein MshF [Shewanella inventionis]GGB62794.1 MSHA biogenesis protein MshF [Shewanella inventionis]